MQSKRHNMILFKIFIKTALHVTLASFCSSAHAGDFMQVYLNPAGLALGATDAGIDFRVAEKVTVGPTFLSMNTRISAFSDNRVIAQGIGGRVNYYLSGDAIGQGWILSALYMKMTKYQIRIHESISNGSTVNTVSTTSDIDDFSLMGGLLGYNWQWGWFNLKLAFGVVKYSVKSPVTISRADGSTKTVALPTSGSTGGGELLIGVSF